MFTRNFQMGDFCMHYKGFHRDGVREEARDDRQRIIILSSVLLVATTSHVDGVAQASITPAHVSGKKQKTLVSHRSR